MEDLQRSGFSTALGARAISTGTAAIGPRSGRYLAGAARKLVARSGLSPSHQALLAPLYLPVAMLWDQVLRFDPAMPRWPDRDRLVVSTTPMLPLLSALLQLTGGDASSLAAGGHAAVEIAAGLAGQSIAAAAGMALAEQRLARRFGHSLVNHRTWLIARELDLETGVALETAVLAGRFRLDRLAVLVGVERQTLDSGRAHELDEALERIRASGWSVRRVDSDDAEAVHAALTSIQRSRKPSLLACVPATERHSPTLSGPFPGAFPDAISGSSSGLPPHGPFSGLPSGSLPELLSGPLPSPASRQPAEPSARPSVTSFSGSRSAGHPDSLAMPVAVASIPLPYGSPLGQDAHRDEMPENITPDMTGPWSPTARRGGAARRSWLRRLHRHYLRAEFERVTAGLVPPSLHEDWHRSWGELSPAWNAASSFDSGERGFEIMSDLLPEMVGLAAGHHRGGASREDRAAPARAASSGRSSMGGISADALSWSAERILEGNPGAPVGRFFDGHSGEWTGTSADNQPHHDMTLSHTQSGADLLRLACGAREPAMVGMMNGMSLHGGVLPSGVASFTSVDRMRPALRFAALSHQRILCMLVEEQSGDNGLADNWQQVEQLASLRAMPNLALFRPAGPRETMACWEAALSWHEGPCVLLVNRRPAFPGAVTQESLLHGRDSVSRSRQITEGTARGGYLLVTPERRDVTLIASGPELAIVLAARTLLAEDGILAAVVSLPSWELFTRQTPSYRDAVLGNAPRVAVEAASGFGWARWLEADGLFIGMNEFSAPATQDALYESFGITPQAIRDRVLSLSAFPQRSQPEPHGATPGRAVSSRRNRARPNSPPPPAL